MNRFEGKTAIVTGGSSGIGRAIAERFAADGAKVLITARSEEGLRAVANTSPNISYLAGDITMTDDVRKLADKADTDFAGKLDILVNCAGWCPVDPITKVTLEQYDKVFSLDVRAVVDLTIHTLPMIIAAKGNIINLSSVGATGSSPNLSMYAGAKAAIEAFTRDWALDLAPYGVRVNAIAPGAIKTNIWNVTNLPAKEQEEHEKRLTSNLPFGRMGTPQEVANVAAFLASDLASYVSGSIYGVTGG